ncbi:arylsulfotransferase family protein [Fulvivirgaceae bacterium BMA12]|uniref:Arylsulfotransferase family protein n=1 Tax=Agaribacillus aureus TaxID=3051825 RepID=A0ABT8LHD2_9BACT|nr:arylsulfotransferase family protein [Fulvivirgaceae bacterium BMA12]
MKFIKQNILKFFRVTVILLFLLSCLGYVFFRLGRGDLQLGPLTKPLVIFATFPTKVKQVLTSNEISGIPPTYVKKDSLFVEFNNLTYDLYGLNAYWNIDLKRWDVALFNFKNDAILHRWFVEKEGLDFTNTIMQFQNSRLFNSLLAEDKSLITSNNLTANLMKLDSNSNVIWRNQERIFHHSLNFDTEKNIWACTSDFPNKTMKRSSGIKNLNGKAISFEENYITKIDGKTGKLLFNKGVSEILIENNYKNFVYGFSNPRIDPDDDPIHLNDIEPVLEDSKYWKKGDVFLSMRHRSLVMLYRPSTNKILRLIYGPFINQHDVDIISGEEISIFNNNYMVDGEEGTTKEFDGEIDALTSSEIVIYNFRDSTFRTHLNQYFVEEEIKTYSQGLHKILSNGDVYVEAENFGKLYLLNEKGIIMRKGLKTPKEGYFHRPNWIRIFEELNF